MKRRKPGEGSIEKLPSGRVRARIVLADGTRHELGTYDTEDEAEGMIAAAVVEAAENDLAPVGGTTLAGFFPRWLDELEVSKSYAAMPNARSIWRCWIGKAPFASWPLRRLEPQMLRAWVKRLKCEIGYRRQILALLRKALGAAVEEGLIDGNPARDVQIARGPVEIDEPWTWLNRDEQQALLNCAEIPLAWRLRIAFAIGCGMRWGEIVSLRSADFRVNDPEPHVMVRYGSRRRGTKGRKIRRIELFGMALDAARQWIRLLPTWCKRNDHGLAWPGPNGGFQKVSRFPDWDGWLRAAGIARRVRPHDLRHTCAASLVSGLWGEPWRLEDVKELLGHASIEETERYAHLCQSAQKRAARGVHANPTIPETLKATGTCDAIGVDDGRAGHREGFRLVIPHGGHAVDLARRVLEDAAAGIPHALDRALELAGLVLDAAPTAARAVG